MEKEKSILVQAKVERPARRGHLLAIRPASQFGSWTGTPCSASQGLGELGLLGGQKRVVVYKHNMVGSTCALSSYWGVYG